MGALTADRVVVELEARLDRYTANVNKGRADFERAMSGIGNSATRSEKAVTDSFNRISVSATTLYKVLGGIGFAEAAKEAVGYSDTFQKVRNQLAAAGVETGKLGATQERVRQIADSTRSSYEATGDLYAKLTRASASLGRSQDDVARATQIVNEAFKAGGASTAEATGGIIQLSQALSSGVLQGDELRSVRENAPLLAKAIADAYGVSVGKLVQLGSQGVLTSEKVFDAILKGGAGIDKQFAATASTVGDAFTRIQTALITYIGTNDKAQGATRALIGALNDLVNNFDTTADVVLKVAGLIAAALTGRALGGMIATLAKGGLELGRLITVLSTVRSAGGFAAIAGELGGLGSAAGPIGAVIGVLAGTLLYLYEESKHAADGADRATEAIKNIGFAADGSIDNVLALIKHLRELSDLQLKGKIADTGDAVSQRFGDIQSLLKATPGTGGVARGRQLPEFGVGGGLSKAFGDLTKGGDIVKQLEDFHKAIDNLGKQFPDQVDLLNKARKAGDDYAHTIEVQTEQFKEADRRANEPATPPKPVTTFHTGAGDSVTAETVGSPRLAEASKSEHAQAVDKETEQLVKDFQATGKTLTDDIREALREFADRIVSAQDLQKRTQEEYKASASGSAFELIKGFEGFLSKAKIDTDGRYRVGYGSDTTTDASGKVSKVTPDTTTTVDDAERDLKRRIGEFEDVVKGQVGGSTFSGLGKEQQAALDSIAYNYGRLPKDIVAAILHGTTADVGAAIRSHADDNGGINRARRDKEADTFESAATDQQKQADDLTKRTTGSTRQVEDLDAETVAINKRSQAVLAGVKAQDYFDAQAVRSEYIRQQQREDADNEIPQTEARIAEVNKEADNYVAAAQRKADADKRARNVEKNVQGVQEAEKFFGDESFDALDGLIGKTEKASEALRKLALDFVQAALKATLLGEGPLAGLFGTTNKAGGVGGLLGTIFSAFGGAKAAGGDVQAGKAYVVGESRPELFIPGRSGTIVPQLPDLPMMPMISPAPLVNPTLNMRFDLSGANGDETIERISRRAAAQAGQQAYAQAVATSRREWPSTQSRLSKHGHV